MGVRSGFSVVASAFVDFDFLEPVMHRSMAGRLGKQGDPFISRLPYFEVVQPLPVFFSGLRGSSMESLKPALFAISTKP